MPVLGNITAAILGKLGGLLNLFRNPSVNGGFILRQRGGVAGTAEAWVSNAGTGGQLRITDAAGNIYFESNNASSTCSIRQTIVDTASGGGLLNIQTSSGRVIVGPSGSLEFRVSSGGSIDTGLKRLAAGVTQATLGASGSGWIQNSGGEAALSAAYTRSDATLTVTNISFTVIAGRSYRIVGLLQVSNTVAGEGVQFDFGGGTATATTFFIAAGVLASGGTVVTGVPSGTTLTTALTFTTITGTCYLMVQGFLKCNAGGTLILRAAEASTATGTATLGIGSWVALADTQLL